MRRLLPRACHPAAWLTIALAAGAGCGFSSSVGGRPGNDAGVDEPIDAPAIDAPPGPCLGPSGWQVCLATRPGAPIALSGLLDTDRSDAANPCLVKQPASWGSALQPEACFLVGDTVAVGSLTATGTRPLVIVATSRITITTRLDVGSHRGAAAGPGSPSTECAAFPRSPGGGAGGGGGGAGGSFTTPAGDGGNGDGGKRQGGQAGEAILGAPVRLRGGCAGQVGGGGSPSGAGGGAVYLVSGGEISINGVIDASGAGGAGGGAQAGGGGGGSGGMIVLYGSSIATTAATLLIANGGGGGGGGGTLAMPPRSTGGDGQDPVAAAPIAAAAGGAAGTSDDGDGGDGGSGFAASRNAISGARADNGGGGGGGGGGAGYIQSSHDLGPATVSPAATIKP